MITEDVFEYTDEQEEFVKQAGKKISDNYKKWPTEVLKALKRKFPNLDLKTCRVVFDQADHEDNTAFGYIIVNRKAAIIFTIRESSDTGEVELDPLDVLFSGDNFEHLNEASLRRAIDTQQPGRVFDQEEDDYSKMPPSNEYVGDLTGDVTPLSYSGFPSHYGASGSSTTVASGLSMTSRVINREADLEYLHNLLNTHSGINSVAEMYGIKDSLPELASGMEENSEQLPTVAHVTYRNDGRFAMVFPNGDSRVVPPKTLKNILLDDYESVADQAMQRGWAVISDVPNMKSVDVPALDPTPARIEDGGYYHVMTSTGDMVPGVFCSQMIDFDGQTIEEHMVITEDNQFDQGKMFTGHQMEELDRHPAGSSVMSEGARGVFLDETTTPVSTPVFEITEVHLMPDDPPVLRVKNFREMTECVLVVLPHIRKPRKIPNHHQQHQYDCPAYYVPGSFRFVEVQGRCDLHDKGENVNMDDRPAAVIHKSANRYDLIGETTRGRVEEKNLEPEEMRVKLAGYGADDYALEKVSNLDNGDDMELYGLTPMHETIKLAEPETPEVSEEKIQQIKEAAEMVLNSSDQAIQSGAEDLEDPQVLDSILSLQFISDETLLSLVQSMDKFREVEDKVAKLLVAARQGEKSIDEQAMADALEGLGHAVNSLASLRIELESRGYETKD